MAASFDYGHQGSDGTWPPERIDDAFYNDGGETFIIGENAAYTTGRGALSAFNAWKDSPPHYNGMVKPEFREMGLYWKYNSSNGYTYWCLTFGVHAEHKTTAER
jgi:uncharacterized protein YkwD